MENLPQLLVSELGIDADQLRIQARIAHWTPDRFRSELAEPGWQSRFRSAVDAAEAEQVASLTARVLATGPVALAAMSHAELVALARDPRLAALAAGYDAATHGGRLVLGPTGVGKTVTCVAALRVEAGRALRRRAAGQEEFSKLAWARALELPAARLGHSLGAGEARLVEQASTAHWLVLDDLGWESRRAGADDVVAEVVARRYDAGLPTLATSGLTLEQLTDRYSDAFVRRLVESGGKPGKVLSLWPREARH